MSSWKLVVGISLSILLALAILEPALAAPVPAGTSATLSVSVTFTPNNLPVNSQTTGSYSIGGGVGPYTIWMNNTPSGCGTPSYPYTTPSPSGTFYCNPSATGNFLVHVTVFDSAGNQGSTTTSLTVTSSGGGTGGNNTGGFNLSGLADLLGVLLIVGIVFIASVVAIAASAVAMAILIPRRLKQIRKVLEGQPLKKPEEEAPPTPPPPQETPSEDEL